MTSGKSRDSRKPTAEPAPLVVPLSRIQFAAQAVVAGLLFLSVLTAPLYEALWGGILGVRGVLLWSVAWALVAAQRCWVLGSRFYPHDSDAARREAARDRWARFLLLVLFLLSAVLFIEGMRDPDSWGLVTNHDQPQYYAYLHSWVFDHDLRFENEYRAIPGTWELMSSAHSETPGYNVAPIGTAVLWLPFYLAAHVSVHLLRHLGVDLTPDGLSSPYATATAVGSIAMAAAGMALVYGFLKRVGSRRAAVFAVLIVWLASPLPWYLREQPWMSHAASFFTGALVLWLWGRGMDRDEGRHAWRSRATLGAAIGLAMLVRPSHAVLVVLPLADAVRRYDRDRCVPGALVGAGMSLVAAVAVFSPQIVVWLARYGFDGPEGSPMAWTSPAVLGVLFSAHHGLFAWHPALLFGFVGVPFLWRRSRHLAVTLAILLIAYVYTNAAILAWYAGGSFGMRRFVGVLPFMAPGLAAFGSWMAHLCKRRPAIPALTLLLGAWAYNSILMKQCREGWADFLRPVSFGRVWSSTGTLFHERFGNPASYPASLPFAWEHGVHPSQYDVASGVPPVPDFDVQGAGLQPYLGKGWYNSLRYPAATRGAFIAKERDCSLLIHLSEGWNYTLDLALDAPRELAQAQSITYGVNGQVLGTTQIDPGTQWVVSIPIQKRTVRHGVNTVDLHFEQRVARLPGSAGTSPARGLEIRTRRPVIVAALLRRATLRTERE